MSKNKKYRPKNFESCPAILPHKKNGEVAKDSYASIYMSMLLSKSWANLSGKQKELYLFCKSQYYGQTHTDPKKFYTFKELEEGINNIDISNRFTMNKRKVVDTFHLYTESSYSTHFYKDINKLIEEGFIEKLESGKSTRTSNIYKFSANWIQE